MILHGLFHILQKQSNGLDKMTVVKILCLCGVTALRYHEGMIEIDMQAQFCGLAKK
jgi:hypothetical protein